MFLICYRLCCKSESHKPIGILRKIMFFIPYIPRKLLRNSDNPRLDYFNLCSIIIFIVHTTVSSV